MTIKRIFADQLFAFHYENEQDNEYDRLLDLWTDAGYLQSYAKENSIPQVYDFINTVLEDARQIEDFLEDIQDNHSSLDFYFEPLQNSEATKVLSLQKGKIRRNILRLYAIKIDDDCFVITGGAIKLSQKMEDHPDTLNELSKLRDARQYLKDNGVFDKESFFELLAE